MELNKEWAGRIIQEIAQDPYNFYTFFLPSTKVEQEGINYRLQPCPVCGHFDCCTITPGVTAVNCFSPKCFSGNHLKFVFDVLGYSKKLLYDIGDFFSVPYPEDTVKTEEQIMQDRMFEIRDIAAKFYHKQFVENDKAITYQVQTRKHLMETLKLFRIGFSANYYELRNGLMTLGYSEDEIKNAKIWFPEGLFVYPYYDPFSKHILRFNTKNPFEVVYKDKVIKGFSVGDKTMMTTPYIKHDHIVLVEGENDLLTVYENGGDSAMAIGGKLSGDQLENLKTVLHKFKGIYCMFDNDEQGQEYENIINNNLPQCNVYKIPYEGKDPDEAYKNNTLLTSVPELLNKALLLDTTEYSITHFNNLWSVANRKQKLEFEILDKNRSGSFVGTVRFFEQGELKDMEYDKTLAKCKFKPLTYYLITAMEDFFNNDLKEKSLEELVSIYFYTKWKGETIRLMANYVFQTNEDDRESIISYLKRCLGEEITDIVLKEINELQNEEILDYSSIPRMKLGQFFSVKNNEAFMYFTYVKKDNDTIRKLPYLVSSDKKLIRLDLYKRKDEQCLILIRNKYEMPVEVPQAIMDLQRISLSQAYVEQYINDEIDSSELEPRLLIRRIENFIRKHFYNDDENLYKVLSLWIYGTYCYELFGQYPYLFLNGPKGSGKTVLDICIDLLAFNPKMTVSITNAALFRSVSTEGGTLILDEMESLQNRNKTADSDLAAVLKGGYMRSGSAMRCDKDNGNTPQMFDVFGPKVISNIAGLEDIIGDRCIQIGTKEVVPADLHKLEDPKQIYIDGLSAVRELTSKCALSILDHFSEIYTAYREKVFNTHNARLSQILRPLQTLAYLAGPDYEKAFVEYYTSTIKTSKEDSEYETPEGALKDILLDIAKEVMHLNEPNYISNNLHKYRNPITINYEEGWFELDVVHIKTFMEEVVGGSFVDGRQVNTFVRRTSPNNMYNRKRRSTISLTDESLIREYGGNTRLKVNIYKYYLTDFFPDAVVAEAMIKLAENTRVPSFEDI